MSFRHYGPAFQSVLIAHVIARKQTTQNTIGADAPSKATLPSFIVIGPSVTRTIRTKKRAPTAAVGKTHHGSEVLLGQFQPRLFFPSASGDDPEEKDRYKRDQHRGNPAHQFLKTHPNTSFSSGYGLSFS